VPALEDRRGADCGGCVLTLFSAACFVGVSLVFLWQWSSVESKRQRTASAHVGHRAARLELRWSPDMIASDVDVVAHVIGVDEAQSIAEKMHPALPGALLFALWFGVAAIIAGGAS